jgi:hypothetical protein
MSSLTIGIFFSESNELPAISDLFLNLIKYGSDVVKSACE